MKATTKTKTGTAPKATIKTKLKAVSSNQGLDGRPKVKMGTGRDILFIPDSAFEDDLKN